ncbi:class I tRNA ligase family protein [Priestia aryabhattai]|nr:class I tRNA ligase family protein [Priestia aryabhattai]
MEAIRKHQQFKVSHEYDVHLKRLYPVADLQTPFGSAHVTLSAGKRSRPHQHHEHETFIILQGSGRFVQAGRQAPVVPGDVLYIEPFSEHYVEADPHNDVEFMSIWWETKDQPRALDSTSYLIFTPPPTPNGDLHLGHICGPYIAADVIRRQLRHLGKQAHLVVGTDKSQSYVDLKARQRGESAQALFNHYADSIMQTFHQAGMEYDSVYDCDSPAHTPFVHDFVRSLQAREVLHLRPETTAWCEHCSLEVFDGFARGACPHCASPSNGCVCEDCGRPNNSHDLAQLHCNLCGNTPVFRSQVKAVLDLQACRLHFAQHPLQIEAPARLETYLTRQEQLPAQDFVVSAHSDWGIAGHDPALKGQTFLAWIEMAAGYIAALYKGTFNAEPKSIDEAIARLNQANVEVIHLMGFDNSFYYAYLYPRLFAALGLNRLRISFVVNEFLLLEQSKFSTSRNHAIWAKDVFSDPETTDWYRLYLSVKRPEGQRENYRHEEFEAFRNDVASNLQHMTRLHHERLLGFNAGVAPLEGGSWTREHEDYSAFFDQQLRHMHTSLTAAGGYSVKQYANSLMNLIDGLQRFQRLTQHHYCAGAIDSERKTSLYLEANAMLGLRQHLGSLMPIVTGQLCE